MKLADKKILRTNLSEKKLAELVEALLKIDQSKAVEEKPKTEPAKTPEEPSKIFKNINEDLNQIFQSFSLPGQNQTDEPKEDKYSNPSETKKNYLDDLSHEHPSAIKFSDGYKEFFFKECDKVFKCFDESVQHKTASDRIRDMLFAVGMDNTALKRFFDKRYDPGWYNKL